MTLPSTDNGEWMMRAYRQAKTDMQNAQQQAINPYNQGLWPYLNPRAWSNPPMAGEPEPEDVTGLKMLEQFLAKRKGERDGDGNERK